MESPWITLQSAGLTAQIDPLGAQLSVLRDDAGRELLWHGDASIWAGRAPILFPIVGTLAGGAYTLGKGAEARQFALPRHGFARGKRFDVITSNRSMAIFRLAADESTLAAYPFSFELDVSFELRAATLTVQATARNTGSGDMPASIGFHPGFRWPLDAAASRENHVLEFECDEPAPVRRITTAGLLSSAVHPTPVQNRQLRLDDALFRDDVLIFDQLRSRSVSYGADTPGAPRLTLGFPDAAWLGVWTRPGAPFVCIEPWQGVTDPEGFAGELWDKPGIMRIPPGGKRALRMTATFSYSRSGVSN